MTIAICNENDIKVEGMDAIDSSDRLACVALYRPNRYS